MKNKWFLFSIIALGFGLSTCTKNSNTCHYAAEPPIPVLFQISKNGILITDSTLLSSIKLSYYQKNIKYYVSNFGLLIGTDNNTYYKKGLMSANIGLINNDSKLYYLEYPTNFSAQDTLYASYLAPSSSTNCQYQIENVTFNGKIPTKNLTDFPFLVYVFNKP